MHGKWQHNGLIRRVRFTHNNIVWLFNNAMMAYCQFHLTQDRVDWSCVLLTKCRQLLNSHWKVGSSCLRFVGRVDICWSLQRVSSKTIMCAAQQHLFRAHVNVTLVNIRTVPWGVVFERTKTIPSRIAISIFSYILLSRMTTSTTLAFTSQACASTQHFTGKFSRYTSFPTLHKQESYKNTHIKKY